MASGDKWFERCQAVEEEKAILRHALTPFAGLMTEDHVDLPNEWPLFQVGDTTIHVGDIRKAAAAMAATNL